MIIIAGNNHIALANQIASDLNASVMLADIRRFGDQELRVQIRGDLCNQDVALLQSISSPVNDNLMALLLMADTAKRAGAKSITAITPYLGYSRQDRPSYHHGPISASLLATLIEAAGVDRLITIDLHSTQAEGFFKIAVQNIDPIPLFSPSFKNSHHAMVVSPDVGGMPRAQKLAVCLGTDLAFINKRRTQAGDCIMNDVIGTVKDKHCIIIDDIIDTGGTLCKAALLLLKQGAQSVSACVTHAVCSGDCFERVAQIPFVQFYVTDTIHQPSLPNKIQVISMRRLMIDALKGF